MRAASYSRAALDHGLVAVLDNPRGHVLNWGTFLERRAKLRFVSRWQNSGTISMADEAASPVRVEYFIDKTSKEALIIRAREMTKKEKRAYAKK